MSKKKEDYTHRVTPLNTNTKLNSIFDQIFLYLGTLSISVLTFFFFQFNKMSNKSNPNVLRCAKQVYTNLQLKERSKLLESNSMPPEVIKLETLFSLTDKPTLDKLIRSFFGWTPTTHRRKNLQDFILMLDKEIDIHST